MSQTFKMVRGAIIIAAVYFGLLFVVNTFFMKVIDSTTIIIGILLPSAMLGLAIGEKFKKKS